MNNLRKYLILTNKMFTFRKAGNEQAEEDIIAELDHHWWKVMDQSEREQANEMLTCDSKEKYLAFQEAWKQFLKEGKHKKQKITYTYAVWNRSKRAYDTGEGFHWISDLTSAHHLFYGMMRNKKLNKMFKPTNKPEGHPLSNYPGLKEAIAGISSAANGNQLVINLLLAPFAGTLDLDDIKRVDYRLKELAKKTSNFTNL